MFVVILSKQNKSCTLIYIIMIKYRALKFLEPRWNAERARSKKITSAHTPSFLSFLFCVLIAHCDAIVKLMGTMELSLR